MGVPTGNVDRDGLNFPGITSTKKFTKSTEESRNFLGDHSRVPYAVALLYGHNVHRRIVLTEEKPSINLNDDAEVVSKLKNSIIDMVVLAPDSSFTSCALFDELHEWKSRDYVLKQHSSSFRLTAPASLNRCDEEDPMIRFAPQLWRYGHMTPLKPNNCRHRKVLVIADEPMDYEIVLGSNAQADLPQTNVQQQGHELREVAEGLRNAANRLRGRNDDVEMGGDDEGSGDGCNLSTDPVIAFEGSADHCNGEQQNPSNAAYRVSRDRERLTNVFNQAVEVPWQSTAHFKNEWIQLSQEHHPGRMPLRLMSQKKYQYWLIYYVNMANPALTRWGCWMCQKYYAMTGENKQYHRTALAKPEGSEISSSYQYNRGKMVRHDGSVDHAASVQFIREQYESGITDIFVNVQRMQECRDKRYRAHNFLMRTVYCEAIENFSFMSHEVLVQLQRLNGVDLGKHFHGYMYAQEITAFYSNTMHKNLILYLKSTTPPVTIMIDECSDKSDHNYLVVLLQAPERNRPVVYFYALLRTTSDLSGDGLATLIKDKLEYDGVSMYFREHLRAFTSDGASVLQGKFNGVCQKLDAFSVHKIVCIWCLSHRINLAGKHSVKTEPHMKILEQTNHKVYLFYNSRAHKRKSHLEETSHRLGVRLYALADNFDIRWVSADVLAFTRLRDNWFALVEDFKKISEGSDFREQLLEQAEVLEHRLLNRNLLLHLHFAIDLLSELSAWSKFSQKKSALLFDKFAVLNKVKEKIGELRCDECDKEEGSLEAFKKEVFCWNDPPNGEEERWVVKGCSEMEIHNSDHVKWRGIELAPKNAEDGISRLHDVRASTIDKVLEQIESYSKDKDQLRDLSTLDPENFPAQLDQMETYGSDGIRGVAKYLNYGEDFQNDLQAEWKIFLQTLAPHPDFIRDRRLVAQKKMDAKAFWHSWLNKGYDFPIPHKVRKIVHICLALAGSSADCERSFSIMKHIRPQSRNQLRPESISHLMRIKYNGPPLEKLNVQYYTEKWLESGKLLVDDQRNIGKHPEKPCQDGQEELSGSSLLF